MSSRTGINVDLVMAYKGKAEVKKAQNDLGALAGEAKKLAGYFGASLGTAAIIGFGKASVKAFAADDKSAKILSNTLVNLGQQIADIPVENFIKNLSEMDGIAKTDLRTAFDSLVRASGSATKAQDLLNLSLDISAGTGKDLATVSTSLAKAYGGNVVALGRLGTGLSKNDLKTKSFLQLQKLLSDLFAGDASVAADSYAGKIARLGTTMEDFKITIGSGIVDALNSVGSSSGLDGFQKGMNTVATDVANTVVGLGEALGLFGKIDKSIGHNTGIHFFHDLAVVMRMSGLGILMDIGKQKKATQDLEKARVAAAGAQESDLAASYANANLARKVANTKAASNAKELAHAKKIAESAAAKLKSERDSLSLKLAGSTADMQNIEIQAALQRGQSKQVVDVLLLQRAILDGNASQAEVLAQQVLKSNGLVMDISGNISSIKGAKNPFGDWPPASASALADITAIQDALAKLVAKPYIVQVIQSTAQNPFIPGAGDTSLSGGSHGGDQGAGAHPNSSSVPSLPSDSGMTLNYNTNPNNGADRAGGMGTVNVTVILDGQTIAGAVTDTLVNNSASGIPSQFSRNQLGQW